jgi:hemerythrin superfamily protein
MQTTIKSTDTKTSSANKAASTKQNVINLLIDDHEKVKKLFKEFEKLSKKNDASKVEIANQICMELTVHALAEEEVFYPVARRAISDDDMMNEADVEHDSAKDLIAQIQSMSSSDEMYDAKVTVLGEYIDHHVKEEENEMFPKVRKAKVDLEELGMQLMMKKEQIMAKLLGPDGELNVKILKQSAIDAASKKH